LYLNKKRRVIFDEFSKPDIIKVSGETEAGNAGERPV
jgi:hypothetical protein